MPAARSKAKQWGVWGQQGHRPPAPAAEGSKFVRSIRACVDAPRYLRDDSLAAYREVDARYSIKKAGLAAGVSVTAQDLVFFDGAPLADQVSSCVAYLY